jgi:hypothetical protein
MEIRRVALLGILRLQEKGKISDVTGLDEQGWFSLEENSPLADIFQYPFTVLRLAYFRLRHNEPDGHFEVNARITSFFHGNSSHPQRIDFGLLPAQVKHPDSLTATLPTPRQAIPLSRYEGVSAEMEDNLKNRSRGSGRRLKSENPRYAAPMPLLRLADPGW